EATMPATGVQSDCHRCGSADLPGTTSAWPSAFARAATDQFVERFAYSGRWPDRSKMHFN
ncbi:MAG: hypothetical protein ACPGVG_09130, partial [Mycobacterium sp.]